eukprot:CAMPEP_0185593300 /NCGR_PEP_ID=MMETSP0434-20130131/71047_1 /TAXON_ID=626734 ORGANISM="Favella taraikaensis, Strain Fe Narragansett Bay" /NCGR_SAMPLE_ID=MMETSP0434 /ASSEMBLY_ACC=CAM_ASM_000379 /LENGTH=59 /DNA_ID=CAMNT_0028219797 /DNA_START=1329 /DNA_END=1506 /DNA_ORIENTATION=+
MTHEKIKAVETFKTSQSGYRKVKNTMKDLMKQSSMALNKLDNSSVFHNDSNSSSSSNQA